MSTTDQARTDKMISQYVKGKALSAIGRKYGITKQRVSQILSETVTEASLETATETQLRVAASRLPKAAKRRFLLTLRSLEAA